MSWLETVFGVLGEFASALGVGGFVLIGVFVMIVVALRRRPAGHRPEPQRADVAHDSWWFSG